jgi:hypothetical protein
MNERLAQLFEEVNMKPNHGRLMSFAQFLVDNYGRKRMDRLAKRLRPALLCWFCEQCADLLDSNATFNHYMTGVESQRTRHALPGVAEIIGMGTPHLSHEVPHVNLYPTPRPALQANLPPRAWF